MKNKILLIHSYGEEEFKTTRPFLYNTAISRGCDILRLSKIYVEIGNTGLGATLYKKTKSGLKVIPKDKYGVIFFLNFTKIISRLLVVLSDSGYKTIRGASKSIAANKLRSYIRCSSLGIPFPRTIYGPAGSQAITYPCIQKPVSGHGGKDVIILDSQDDTRRNREDLLQDLVDDSGPGDTKVDYRAVFTGSEPVFWLKKSVSRESGVATNHVRGGDFEVHNPGEAEKEFIGKVISAFPELKFGAIDYVQDKSGKLWFLEINSFPDFKITYELTGFNLLEPLLDYLEEVKL